MWLARWQQKIDLVPSDWVKHFSLVCLVVVCCAPMAQAIEKKHPLEIESRLRNTVFHLTEEIGSRSFWERENLERSAQFILGSFRNLGYECSVQVFPVEGQEAKNIIAEKKGTENPRQVIIVGAHYDTVPNCPGADDNASGVAVLLELARLVRALPNKFTVRFVAFSLEEPPFFETNLMGSRAYVRSLIQGRESQKDSEYMVGMICLESVGYYTNEEGSQRFPLPFLGLLYPDKGNFITVVSNFSSRKLANKVAGHLQEKTACKVETFIGPSAVTGVRWSDHASFWDAGLDAVMLTDTAPFRNPNYHQETDRIDTLDFSWMAQLTLGLAGLLHEVEF